MAPDRFLEHGSPHFHAHSPPTLGTFARPGLFPARAPRRCPGAVARSSGAACGLRARCAAGAAMVERQALHVGQRRDDLRVRPDLWQRERRCRLVDAVRYRAQRRAGVRVRELADPVDPQARRQLVHARRRLAPLRRCVLHALVRGRRTARPERNRRASGLFAGAGALTWRDLRPCAGLQPELRQLGAPDLRRILVLAPAGRLRGYASSSPAAAAATSTTETAPARGQRSLPAAWAATPMETATIGIARATARGNGGNPISCQYHPPGLRAVGR